MAERIVVVVAGREVMVVCSCLAVLVKIVAHMDCGLVVEETVMLHLQYEMHYNLGPVVHELLMLVGAYVGAVVFAH